MGIMMLTKRVTWESRLKHGVRTTWLGVRASMWFGVTGMFRKYRKVTRQIRSKLINSHLAYAREQFPVEGHCDGPAGSLNEDISEYVQLCREFEDWKLNFPSTSTQQTVSRIVTAVTQQALVQLKDTLGNVGGGIRSQIGEDNRENLGNSRLFVSSRGLGEAASVVGLVERTGVVAEVVPLVAEEVTDVVTCLSPRQKRHGVISHIERSHKIQASPLAESLGGILNNMLYPIHTISDIIRDYTEATHNFRNAVDAEEEIFLDWLLMDWRITCVV